jgi:hypothetical protein
MKTREINISNRLKAIATILQVDKSNLISIKFYPLMPSEDETIFGKYSTAYQYLSEYNAGLEQVKVVKPDNNELNQIGREVSHPMPYGENEKVVFVIKDKNLNDVYWIQHETGLEIVGSINDILEIALGIIGIYKAIRNKIKENKNNKNSDRYYAQVSKTVITKRSFHKNGNLKEEIIEESEIINESFGLSKEEFIQRLKE